MGGVSGLLVAAANADDQRPILYLHGGGYCKGSSLTHRDFGWRLSAAVKARVLLLDYRLAPEHPFPTAVTSPLASCQPIVGGGIVGTILVDENVPTAHATGHRFD